MARLRCGQTQATTAPRRRLRPSGITPTASRSFNRALESLSAGRLIYWDFISQQTSTTLPRYFDSQARVCGRPVEYSHEAPRDLARSIVRLPHEIKFKYFRIARRYN